MFSASLSSGTSRWLAAITAIVALASGVGFAFPALGGVEVLSQVAVDLVQPRIRNLTRIARLVGAFSLAVTASSAFFLVWLVPEAQRGAWVNAPLAGVSLALAGPPWLRAIALVAVVGAAVVFLAAAARSAAAGAHGVLSRLVDEGILGRRVEGPSIRASARPHD